VKLTASMKAFITKYALTQGILEVNDAQICVNISDQMISVPSLGPFSTFHGEGREWHRTKETAIARAAALRDRKITALKKKIEELQRLKFT
jgi:hypothetical protein